MADEQLSKAAQQQQQLKMSLPDNPLAYPVPAAGAAVMIVVIAMVAFKFLRVSSTSTAARVPIPRCCRGSAATTGAPHF
jgi:hypothetical protein